MVCADECGMTTTKPTTVTVHEIEAKSLTFRKEDRLYLWGEGETSDVTGPARVSDVHDDWGLGDGVWCIFYLADCFSPPFYAVQGRTFEDAYEAFIDWHVESGLHGLKIEEHELVDYNEESLHYTSNGVPVDTECVQGFEVKLVSITA